jgi:hypothetical protein
MRLFRSEFGRFGSAASQGSRAITTDLRTTPRTAFKETEKDGLAPLLPPISLPRPCFPLHEIIEGSSSFILNQFDDTCVIDEAEKRGLVRNQIEWVHQIL